MTDVPSAIKIKLDQWGEREARNATGIQYWTLSPEHRCEIEFRQIGEALVACALVRDAKKSWLWPQHGYYYRFDPTTGQWLDSPENAF